MSEIILHPVCYGSSYSVGVVDFDGCSGFVVTYSPDYYEAESEESGDIPGIFFFTKDNILEKFPDADDLAEILSCEVSELVAKFLEIVVSIEGYPFNMVLDPSMFGLSVVPKFEESRSTFIPNTSETLH